MAAAGEMRSQHPHAVYQALESKRRSIEWEIEQFRLRKEHEFQTFKEQLSNGSLSLDQLGLHGHDALSQHLSVSDTHSLTENTGGRSSMSMISRSIDGNRPASPSTPRHDKEKELHGLFLPHFIPLLDDARTKNLGQTPTLMRPIPGLATPSASPPTPPSRPLDSSSSVEVSKGDDINLSNSFNESSPHKNPSAASSSSSPDLEISDRVPTASSISQDRSPSPPEELPSDLPLLTRSPRRTPDVTPPSPELSLSPHTRPSLPARTSSSHSEGSTTSLRSSLRKSPGSSLHGRKKSVRISIDDVVMAPGGHSPVQFRNGWKLPERKNPSPPDGHLNAHINHTSDGGSESGSRNGPPHRPQDDCATRTSHEQTTSPIAKLKSSSLSNGNIIKRSTPKRGKRPASLDHISPRGGIDLSFGGIGYPSPFPSQPMRSPTKSPSRPTGRDLIEPLSTPLREAVAADQDDFFMNEPLFDTFSRRTSTDEVGNKDLFSERRNGAATNKANMHEDVDLERTDMDVHNGHDWEDEKDIDDNAPANGRLISREDSGGWKTVEMSGTSPHAGSLPIEIRGPRGWGCGGISNWK